MRLLMLEKSGFDLTDELEEISQILQTVELQKIYKYDDLEREIPKGHRSADIHYVHEILIAFGYRPKLYKNNKRHLVLELDYKSFRFAKREIQNKEYGFLYLFHSPVCGYCKIGRTELLLKKRHQNYETEEQWTPIFSVFCQTRLRTKERHLKQFCKDRFLQAPRGCEFFYIGCLGVVSVIKYMKLL